jgi:hypothetical protein
MSAYSRVGKKLDSIKVPRLIKCDLKSTHAWCGARWHFALSAQAGTAGNPSYNTRARGRTKDRDRFRDQDGFYGLRGR